MYLYEWMQMEWADSTGMPCRPAWEWVMERQGMPLEQLSEALAKLPQQREWLLWIAGHLAVKSAILPLSFASARAEDESQRAQATDEAISEAGRWRAELDAEWARAPLGPLVLAALRGRGVE